TARAELVLDKILDLTARSTSSIGEIARATEEQARGSATATAAIEEVTKMVQQTATATQQQSQTARKVGEQAATVRDYTKHLKRAMSEQETGSRAISKAMENVMGLVQNVLHATLVIYGEGAELMPGMAERWEVLEQGHVYRFHLRRGVRFSNGRTFEAKDVHDSLVRLLLPENNSGASWLLLNVRGAKEVLEGRTRVLTGIVARDANTVDI